MNKIIMLGTGSGFNDYFYNTCFVLRHNDKNMLIDAGGSQKIYYKLLEKNIKLEELQDIFISHAHMDHVFGLVWLFKAIYGMLHMQFKINVYCNQYVCDFIKTMCEHTLAKKTCLVVYNNVNFVVVKPGDKLNIIGLDFSFFDSYAKGVELTCFETNIEGKSLVFLGDTTCAECNYEILKNKDYVMHEALCLDKDADIYYPYEKNHATVKSICDNLKDLNIQNIIIYHTVDDYKEKRKQEFLDEAKKCDFKGNVIVPEDMEEIILS